MHFILIGLLKSETRVAQIHFKEISKRIHLFIYHFYFPSIKKNIVLKKANFKRAITNEKKYTSLYVIT